MTTSHPLGGPEADPHPHLSAFCPEPASTMLYFAHPPAQGLMHSSHAGPVGRAGFPSSSRCTRPLHEPETIAADGLHSAGSFHFENELALGRTSPRTEGSSTYNSPRSAPVVPLTGSGRLMAFGRPERGPVRTRMSESTGQFRLAILCMTFLLSPEKIERQGNALTRTRQGAIVGAPAVQLAKSGGGEASSHSDILSESARTEGQRGLS